MQLIDNLRQFFNITPYEEIIPWAEKNIDYSKDVSAQRNRLDFSFYPYQIDIIKTWEDLKHIKTVTVVAPEQTGKTNSFLVGIIWRMVFAPSQSLILYPSDSLAAETNVTKLQPVMKRIPQLKKQLEQPRSYRSDRYKFSNLISYFQGAGTRAVSKSCQIVVGDQCDSWPVIGSIDNMSELKKRTRSYDSSIAFYISTPTTEDGKIWKSFLKSSMGYWHLRCPKCMQLTMKSCDLHNLQFESDYNQQLRQHIVKSDTIRLVCPVCKHEATEEEKRWMNINGGYIHEVPQRIDEAPGFQVGALASQLPSLSWKIIAQAILDAGKRSDIQTQITLDNSFKGLPYKRRTVVKQDFEKLRIHEWKQSEQPSIGNVEALFVSVDTQDEKSVVVVGGFDVNDNVFVLEEKQVQYMDLKEEERNRINDVLKQKAAAAHQVYKPVQTVLDVINKEYLIAPTTNKGIKPLFALIDSGGHRTTEVEFFSMQHQNVYMYKGTRMETQKFKVSDTNRKLFLCAAKKYQADLIYYLYSQKKRGNDYLYFHPGISDEFIKQVVCIKPDSSKKFGDNPQQWGPQHGEVHDFFDSVKMLYVCIDIAIKMLSRNRFRFCKSPMLLKRFGNVIVKQEEKEQKEVKKVQNSWFSS